MREAYRQSPYRHDPRLHNLEAMFIFSGRSIESYASVKKATDLLLVRLSTLDDHA